jgi:hypothetical protein
MVACSTSIPMGLCNVPPSARMLSKASGGSVVCQRNDDSLAHMGELSAETFVYKGVNEILRKNWGKESKEPVKMFKLILLAS